MIHMFAIDMSSPGLNGLFGNNYYLQWVALVLVVLSAAFLLAKVLGKLQKAVLQHRAARRTTIIAEYESFKELLPHELGYLYDNAFADNEFFAVLLQLSDKNALKISKMKDDIYFEAYDVPKSQLQNLSSAEQSVYGIILARPSRQVKWSELSANVTEVNGPQGIFETSTIGDLATKGYIDLHAKYLALREQKTAIKIASFLLTLVILFVPYQLAFGGYDQSGNGFAAVDAMVVKLLFVMVLLIMWPAVYFYCHADAYVYYRAAGLPAGSTNLLRARWPVIVGYREYIRTVELNRLENDENIDDPMLPVCIAYGLYPSWLKRLKLDA